MTPDIATEYYALVHIKTTGCGDNSHDRDGSFTHTYGVMHLFPTGVKKVNCGMAWFLRKTLLSFTDVPKSQTLIPLKSQKTEVFEPYCNLQYHGFRVYNACCLPAAQRAL